MKTIADLLDVVQIWDAMLPVKFTISPTQKLNSVAKLFQENGIDAAPVVGPTGKCVGILTSCDLVRFQAELPEVTSHIDLGMSFAPRWPRDQQLIAGELGSTIDQIAGFRFMKFQGTVTTVPEQFISRSSRF